jgi:hypothetical protein
MSSLFKLVAYLAARRARVVTLTSSLRPRYYSDAVKISPHIPSTCTQNVILSLRIIPNIPSRLIYVGIDSPSLFPSIVSLTTSSYLWNYVRAANNVSHAENLQSNGCQCFSYLYKF